MHQWMGTVRVPQRSSSLRLPARVAASSKRGMPLIEREVPPLRLAYEVILRRTGGGIT